MGSVRRKTLPLKVKLPDLKSIKELSNQLKAIQRGNFVYRYGKILDLLTIKVQTGALTALAQYYDPLLRCFTFQDFQLAPTLEEFEQILGYPLGKGNPFRRMGQVPKLEILAKILKIDIRELASKEETKGSVHGFSRGYLEKKAQDLVDNQEWNTFIDVLALIIYGIVLFPNIDNFVDFAAINVFIAFNENKENPVPAVLADVYYSLHVRHEKKGGVILCCLAVWYKWFISLMFKKGYVEETRSNRDWAQSIANLNGNSISWYSRKQEIGDIIYQCGDFPNVPLMGTKGCINYNPALALRPLGYPMREKPADKLWEDFVLHDMGMGDPSMLRRISRAWDRIIRKGRELGGRSCAAEDPYRQWVMNRVQEIKLPFHYTCESIDEKPEPTPITNEEVEELKAALSKLEEEKKKLQERLEKTTQENRDLQREIFCKNQFIERSNKRAKIEGDRKLDFQQALKGANEELDVRNRERDEARERADMWMGLWSKSSKAEKDLKRELEKLKQKLQKVAVEYENRIDNERRCKDEMEETLMECQDTLKREQEYSNELKGYVEYQEQIYEDMKKESMDWEDRFAKLANLLENNKIYQDLRSEGLHWRNCFSKLAGIANQAIMDIPRHLEGVDEAMHPLNTPVKVYKFVEYCKSLIEELKEKAGLLH